MSKFPRLSCMWQLLNYYKSLNVFKNVDYIMIIEVRVKFEFANEIGGN